MSQGYEYRQRNFKKIPTDASNLFTLKVQLTMPYLKENRRKNEFLLQ